MPDTRLADDGADADAGELGALAARLAGDAGRLALDARRALGGGSQVAHQTKSSATDPVTEFDRAAEALIVGELRRLRPDDGIVGEEGASREGTTGIDWHIDPIDGTVNFVYDLPAWSVSVAAVDADGSLAGAVYAPALGELFAATRGGGATRNDEPIVCSTVETLDVALVATGFSYQIDIRKRQAALVAKLLGEVRDIRRLGSAALDLSMVACGRVDAYFEEQLNSWDLAAGALIAAEAGATVSGIEGVTPIGGAVVAAPPALHARLLAMLHELAD